MIHQIKNRYSSKVLFEHDCVSYRQCVEIAVSKGIYLRNANLAGLDLSHAQLRRARFYGAYLEGTNLDCSDLTGADIHAADLRCATACGANLASADLSGSCLKDMHLKTANLQDANLDTADLSCCDLSFTNLRGANLRDANVACAIWHYASMQGANISTAGLIDGGHDHRGYRFWAWRNKDGGVVYRAGCREWTDFNAALEHYSLPDHTDDARMECIERLTFLNLLVQRRWGLTN